MVEEKGDLSCGTNNINEYISIVQIHTMLNFNGGRSRLFTRIVRQIRLMNTIILFNVYTNMNGSLLPKISL